MTMTEQVHGIAPGLEQLAVPIDRLDTLEGNPRKGDIDAVARSLTTFGQRKPITARHRPGGRLEVTAGNHTMLAARQLGWTHVAAVVLDDDDSMAKAWALADNRTGDLGTYDQAALAAMLEEVANAGADLLSATSYSLDDLSRLVLGTRGDGLAPDPDLERVPEPPAKPYSKPGDLWLLGAHRLVCGDSTKPADINLALDGQPADMVFTSPPYNVGIAYTGWDDFKSWTDYRDLLAGVLEAVVAHLGPGRAVCWNIGTSPKTYPHRQMVLMEDAGLAYHRTMIWQKPGVPVPLFHQTRDAAAARHFMPNYTHELVLVFAKGDAPADDAEPDPAKALAAFARRPFAPDEAHGLVAIFAKGGRLEKGGPVTFGETLKNDVFTVHWDTPAIAVPSDPDHGVQPGTPGAGGRERAAEWHATSSKFGAMDRAKRTPKAHPAPFPVALPEAFIVHLADVGATVLDPFAGAGSTLLAAMRTGRLGAGVELDPRYVDVAVLRWQRVTGDTPLLVRGGRKPKAVDLASMQPVGNPSDTAELLRNGEAVADG